MPRKVIGPLLVAARISARCRVPMPVLSRDRPPPMCSRQDASAAAAKAAPVRCTAAILSASIAPDTAGFFSANVPPNPQHCSASGSSTRSMPLNRAQQPQRPLADPQQPQRMAGRVVGHPVREVRPDVGHAQHVGQEFRQLPGAGRDRLRRLGQRRVTGQPGHVGVLVPDRGRARPARHHDRVVALERRHMVADQRDRLPRVAAVDVHLPAAGLRPGHLHAHAQPFQHPDRGLAHLRRHAVHQARDEQGGRHHSIALTLPNHGPWPAPATTGRGLGYFRLARSTTVTIGSTNSPAAVSGCSRRSSRTWSSSRDRSASVMTRKLECVATVATSESAVRR